MMGISRQLGIYFVLIAMLSVAFITVVSNISINLFFYNYIEESWDRDDLKVVQYVEQVYSDSNGLDAQSQMSLMHYSYSQDVIVRLRDLENQIIWDSGAPEIMNGIGGNNNTENDKINYRNYSFSYKGKPVGSIDIGRPKSIISSLEDKEFLETMNVVFAIAFVFSVFIAMLSSRYISKKFLQPIYLIKENARLIKNGKYRELKKVSTYTDELYDLSVSVNELAERLDQQEALRKRMSTDIAHELRTPLATVRSHIEAFMDGVWEPDMEKLSIIYDEVSRLTGLIQELSDLSIIESDEIKLNKTEVNLSALVGNIAESFEPLFLSKNIHLRTEIRDDIGLLADEDKLNRIFINILSNALKYTNKKGNVQVTLVRSQDAAKVTVEDDGIGISKEDIKHVFDRFYRGDLSRSRGTGGTGIGLTITKALVEAHGGSIAIESEESKGTRVIITFPIIDERQSGS